MNKFSIGRKALGMVFILTGVLLLKETYTFEGGFMSDASAMGPMTYPRYLLFGWTGASVCFFILPGRNDDRESIQKSGKSLLMATVLITAYVFLFQHIGLLESTILFLLAFFHAEGYRNLKRSVPIALVSSLAFWYIFEKILSVPMPAGMLSALME